MRRRWWPRLGLGGGGGGGGCGGFGVGWVVVVVMTWTIGEMACCFVGFSRCLRRGRGVHGLLLLLFVDWRRQRLKKGSVSAASAVSFFLVGWILLMDFAEASLLFGFWIGIRT